MNTPATSVRPDDDMQAWLVARLAEPDLWKRLGFDGQDLADVRRAARAVVAPGEQARAARDRIRLLAGRLALDVGVLARRAPVFGDMQAEALPVDGVDGHGWGVLALVALAATVPEVRALHAGRGIPDDVSWASLGDLAQQVRVHRRTYGEFGLHALPWLTTHWSGALYALGRLQFNLHWYEPGDAPVMDPRPRWVLSTHIPATGPLDPGQCDESFARAPAFFAEHFPDLPVEEFHCDSWLLDARLAELPVGSNTARFQARWTLEGPGRAANSDAWFFIWGQRGEVDPADLPVDSSLRRLVRDEVLAGRPWLFQQGIAPI